MLLLASASQNSHIALSSLHSLLNLSVDLGNLRANLDVNTRAHPHFGDHKINVSSSVFILTPQLTCLTSLCKLMVQ
jgi:hypothetical protein